MSEKDTKKKKGGKKADDAPKAPPEPPPVPRLLVKYNEEVAKALQEKFNLANVMEIPRVMKVAINMGLGEAVQTPKLVETAAAELALIAGQKPVITKARKSIASFKLREGVSIGCMVTLRRYRMWEFLDRLLNVALPRVRDFKGVSPKAFDGRGNFTLGLKEQIIFPEIDYDKVEKISGLNVTVVTSARNDEEARELLRFLGMPFRI